MRERYSTEQQTTSFDSLPFHSRSLFCRVLDTVALHEAIFFSNHRRRSDSTGMRFGPIDRFLAARLFFRPRSLIE